MNYLQHQENKLMDYMDVGMEPEFQQVNLEEQFWSGDTVVEWTLFCWVAIN